MNKLVIESSEFGPGIVLNHQDREFCIKGSSRPEDVRNLYSPVVDWINNYQEFLSANPGQFSQDDPFTFKFDLSYFNSSSAKFLYDIIKGIKTIKNAGVPVKILWISEEEDFDMVEAGEDLALLAEIDFEYITKERE